ncbi:unnamed protein product [Miscanthus lutarioriparius]|uniref:Uncharacterized protein n=1 Tax=Miscanthus lutarioriparius TaxID=422564 RepID=A0A811SC43_9POAL|nr:unnamed protein product [Miscanthus lutarioriparius]
MKSPASLTEEHVSVGPTRMSPDREKRLGRQIKDLEQAQDARVSALEKAAVSFDVWQPSIEGTIDDICLEVKKISFGWERASITHPEDKSGYHGNSNSKIPKVDFPRFDGDHPKLWLSDCLDYFSLYHVESISWEDLSAQRKPEVRKWDVSSRAKPFARMALPLPLPPARVDKPMAPVELKPAPNIGRAPSTDERWAALRSLRRSQGLCFRYGSKWSRDHRCPQVVQLQVLEEVLGLFSLEESTEPSDAVVEEPEPAQLQLILSVAAVSRVQVANGQALSCTQFIHSAVWSVQGLQFKSDIKVLLLSSYDMILGLDWLESHSPMQVHWAHKWLKIPYEGTTVQLHGLLSSILEGSII